MTAGQRLIVVDRSTGRGPAQFGKNALFTALAESGIGAESHPHPGEEFSLVIGTTEDALVRDLLHTSGIPYSTAPGGVLFRRFEAARLVAGTDARGLMYALLELADRLRHTGPDALADLEDLTESPEFPVRGLDRFIMGPLDDEWFLSDDFWKYYLDRLARCRFNRFALVTGFDTAYLSPPYPFFVEVPGFPDISVEDFTAERRETYRRQLEAIGRLCHDRGLEFIFGTWQQTPWTKAQEQLVVGLPEEELELARYCAAGLRTLIEQCPSIDGIHFRVNLEAGIGDRNTNEAFWHECIRAVADANPDLKLDLRAKGLTDGMIEFAQRCGLRVSVPTKYWCEHAGLPYHLTRMRTEELTRLDNLNHSRRYSYADLLRKPRRVDLIYRLWNQGSNTLFPFGDPDYARRYILSGHLGHAAGFEIAAPLTMKGGHYLVQKEPWLLHKAPELRSGRWEDERYELWYLLFGRLGYNPSADPGIWRRALRARFGQAAPHLERALAAAGKLLPLLTAAHMPQHPMLHYWTEMSTGAPLFPEHAYDSFNGVSYATAEPSDPGLFYGIAEYARDLAENALERKYTPSQISAWLTHLSTQIDAALLAADQVAPPGDHPEFQALKVDLLMLRDLAAFHAAKHLSALALARYEQSRDNDQLRAAHAFALTFLDRWQTLSARGAAAYTSDLEFGAGNGAARRGTWQDRLPEVEKDVERLKTILSRAGLSPAAAPSEPASLSFTHPAFTCDLPDTIPPNRNLDILLTVGPLSPLTSPHLHYRHVNQLEGTFQQIPMEPIADGFTASIPADYITPEWDLLIYFSAIDPDSTPILLPGIFHPEHPFPYFIVEVAG